MQLLRDNLTLWTSSDGADADETPAKEDKPVEAESKDKDVPVDAPAGESK